jgi:ArsR family transcriptional regulator
MNDAQLVRVLKALADPNRFKMVQEIAAKGELSCGRLGERFSLSQPTISHHLKLLADAGIVIYRREAQQHLLTVDRVLLAEVGALLPERLRVLDRPKKSPQRTRRAAAAP